MGHQRSELRASNETPATMKTAIILILAAVAYARPAPEGSSEDSFGLLRSDITEHDGDGTHSMDFAVDNGIDFQLSGQEGEDGGAHMVGSYTYIVDGEAVPLTFVADEGGFQPDSSLLPVAPAFPHEIPEWVLEQIAVAESQRSAEE